MDVATKAQVNAILEQIQNEMSAIEGCSKDIDQVAESHRRRVEEVTKDVVETDDSLWTYLSMELDEIIGMSSAAHINALQNLVSAVVCPEGFHILISSILIRLFFSLVLSSIYPHNIFMSSRTFFHCREDGGRERKRKKTDSVCGEEEADQDGTEPESPQPE